MQEAADKSLESWIGGAACSIRGSKDAPKFKEFILPLIFTKRLCDVFNDEINRMEVWNPGTLPPSLTLEKLRHPHGSVPGNPLLAEPLYLTKYIERMGTGTGDMIQRCRHAGLAGPGFTLTDGFVITIRRKPGRAFAAARGQVSKANRIGENQRPFLCTKNVFWNRHEQPAGF